VSQNLKGDGFTRTWMLKSNMVLEKIKQTTCLCTYQMSELSHGGNSMLLYPYGRY